MGDPKSLAEMMDRLQTLRIDAVIVPMPPEQAESSKLDAFDELVSQASRRGIRVVLAMPASGAVAEASQQARFWLSRGIAGFYVFTPAAGVSGDVAAEMQAVRAVTSTAVGGRVVISDRMQNAPVTHEESVAHQRRRRRPETSSNTSINMTGGVAQLQIDAHVSLPAQPDAAALRALIAAEPQNASVMLELKPPEAGGGTADPYVAITKSVAAIELLTHPIALIGDAGIVANSGAGSEAAAEWERQLIALHHGNATLRYGTATALDFDSQNALVWVSRTPQEGAAMLPVVVVCNLTSSRVHLSLGAAVGRLGLRGSFLRTLLRTDDSMGPQDLDDVSIPAFGVYIGELRR
jgi:hypothetical protein